jgi:lipopolysaccharide assembly protein A
MQFLKTILWVAIAVVAVIFSLGNWTPVTLNLWGGLQVDTVLPVVMLAAFLLGIVPYFILHRATRWSLNRRLTTAERTLSEYRSLESPSLPVAREGGAMPPGAAPMAVPPGVS